MTETHTTWMRGPAGALEVDIDVPAQCTRGIAFLLHPLTTGGGSKAHKVVTVMSRAFNEAGFLSVRPNLRGAGKSEGAFDEGIGETEDFLQVIEQSFLIPGVSEELPLGGQVVFGGFSFGTYVAALASEIRNPAALVFAGMAAGKFPVPHPRAPVFMAHGENDEIIPLPEALGWALEQDTSVTVIPGADHFFSRRLQLLKKAFSQFINFI